MADGSVRPPRRPPRRVRRGITSRRGSPWRERGKVRTTTKTPINMALPSSSGPGYDGTSCSQCVSQRHIDLLHCQRADDSVDCRKGHRSEVVGHHDRVRKQTGSPARGRIDSHEDTTRVAGTKQSATDHGDDDLRQSGIEMIRLHDERRPYFGGVQIGMRVKHEDDVATATALLWLHRSRHTIPSPGCPNRLQTRRVAPAVLRRRERRVRGIADRPLLDQAPTDAPLSDDARMGSTSKVHQESPQYS
jgi:hypothetical protein